MKKIHLQHLSSDNKLIEALFSPSHGMNLLSFKKDNIEFIDQSTTDEFESRFAGLGALIGPHFYHRKSEETLSTDYSVLFPDINENLIKEKGDPLSHGIGRYSSWNYENSSTTIHSHLSGLDTINTHTLASIEGFNFRMNFSCHLTNNGLNIDYDITSDGHPCTIGLHYYLALPNKTGRVKIPCNKQYNDLGTWKDIPKEWLDDDNNLDFDLSNKSDFGFIPNTDNNTGSAILETEIYSLKISYKAHSDQHAFQLYHPENSSFVCIEPVSAKDPRASHGSEHKLNIKIEVI